MHILCLISVHIILSDWKLIEQIILCDTWSWYLCVCTSVCLCTGSLQTSEPRAGELLGLESNLCGSCWLTVKWAAVQVADVAQCNYFQQLGFKGESI